MRNVLVLSAMLCLSVMGLESVPAAAPAAAKPSLAVFDFANSSAAAWWTGGVGSDMADMLTNELASTEKFTMVERKQLGAVLGEQALGTSGAVTKATAAKTGKMTGAKYIVTGKVSAYEENTKGTGGGLAVGGIGFGGKKEEAYIAIDLRVVDTTTGEITYTRTVEARSSSKGIAVGVAKGGVAGGFGKVDKTPAGKAIRGCLLEIASYLECAMVDKGGCLAEYDAKEKARKEKTKGSIKLD